MSIFGYSQQPSYSNLVGKKVRINRGGPDSVEGILYAVESNYLIVLAKDGVVYIKTVHVKSITVSLDGKGKSGGTSAGRTSGRSQGTTRPIIVEYNFYGVLNKLKHQQVQINRGGPEKIEGLLVDVTSDTVLIIVKNELVRVLLSHIKSLTVPWKSASKSSGKNKKSSGNKTAGNTATGGNKNRGKSRGNATAGNAATGGNKNRGKSRGNTTVGNVATGGNRNNTRGQRLTRGSTSVGAGRRSGGNSGNKGRGTRSVGHKATDRRYWDPFPQE